MKQIIVLDGIQVAKDAYLQAEDVYYAQVLCDEDNDHDDEDDFNDDGDDDDNDDNVDDGDDNVGDDEDFLV